ncbi:MAG: hypothetical protein AAFW70_05440 [Cyanobacteria bacterium J06635_10]
MSIAHLFTFNLNEGRRKKEEGRRLELGWGFKPQPIHAERGAYLPPLSGGELNPYV